MEKFREVFGNKHVVLLVIHVKSVKQTISNIIVANEAGADGVFLINHRLPFFNFFEICTEAMKEFLDVWVGINCLDLKPHFAFQEILKWNPEISGIWTDNALINEKEEKQPWPERIKSRFLRGSWQGLYFGGVAFKYQRQVHDLEKAAKIAANYMDVVTTSGPATGQAADVKKIRQIRQAIPGKPLAIASGITPENVKNYLELADCFLVATGISKNFYTLDETKTKRLIEIVREENH